LDEAWPVSYPRCGDYVHRYQTAVPLSEAGSTGRDTPTGL